MADSRFFMNKGPFSLGELAEKVGAELGDGADAAFQVSDVAPLDTASATDLSFLENRKYIPSFERSSAGACIVAPAIAKRAPAGMKLLIAPDAYRAYALAAQLFYPIENRKGGISASAVVHPTAKIDAEAMICPGAVIGSNAEIGARTIVGANTTIEAGVIVGKDCHIHANCTLQYTIVGDYSIIHAGTRIGQDGFGFAMGPNGHLKVPQLGRVLIGNDVEIGSNCTIDRGAGPDTVIGDGTRIDNLVQIGHNVKIGRGCVLVSFVGVSGSTEFGDFVIAAGQVGVAGHLKIGHGAQIAAQSGVIKDIEPGEKVGGTPALPLRQWQRQCVTLAALVRKDKGLNND